MTKNIEDLLYRGDSLERMGDISSRLREDSRKYKKAAVRINWELLLKQVSPPCRCVSYTGPLSYKKLTICSTVQSELLVSSLLFSFGGGFSEQHCTTTQALHVVSVVNSASGSVIRSRRTYGWRPENFGHATIPRF
jgi:hypothetical protein